MSVWKKIFAKTEGASTYSEVTIACAIQVSFKAKTEDTALVCNEAQKYYCKFKSIQILDGRQGNCFTSRENDVCRNRLPHRLSKKDCCCGVNMGQGWGDDCTRCPHHGEGTSSYLNIFEKRICNGFV